MDTVFSTRVQLELVELSNTLERFAREMNDPFSERESAWLRMEHSGTLPPVLGALDEHERFESRVRRSVIHGYSRLESDAPAQAKQFRELVNSLRSTSYAAQLAEPAILQVSGEPIAKDIGRFAMLFLGQGMRIFGLALMVFVLLAFFIRC